MELILVFLNCFLDIRRQRTKIRKRLVNYEMDLHFISDSVLSKTSRKESAETRYQMKPLIKVENERTTLIILIRLASVTDPRT